MGRWGFGMLVLCGSLFAQAPDTAFFEAKIRPVLVAKCYGCHASTLSSPQSGLSLDTKAAMLKGGDGGPVIVPGKPADSRLLSAEDGSVTGTQKVVAVVVPTIGAA